MKTDTGVNCVNLHYLRRRLSCASVDILLLFCLLCRLHILIRFSNLNDVRFNYFFVLKMRILASVFDSLAFSRTMWVSGGRQRQSPSSSSLSGSER